MVGRDQLASGHEQTLSLQVYHPYAWLPAVEMLPVEVTATAAPPVLEARIPLASVVVMLPVEASVTVPAPKLLAKIPVAPVPAVEMLPVEVTVTAPPLEP